MRLFQQIQKKKHTSKTSNTDVQRKNSGYKINHNRFLKLINLFNKCIYKEIVGRHY